MKTDSDTPEEPAGAGSPPAPCSLDLPFELPTPHAALEKVIEWLGIGYVTTITRRSDGKKITLRITSENAELGDRSGSGTPKQSPDAGATE